MNDGGTTAGAGTHQPEGPRAGQDSPNHQWQSAQRTAGIGWLFLAPALVLVLFQQVIPLVRTAWLSLQVDPLGASGTLVGLQNYADVLGGLVHWTLRASVLLGLMVAVAGFLIGFGLGRLGSRATGTARRIGLALAGLALVGIAPMATMLGLSQWVELRSVAPLAAIVVWVPATIVVGFLIGVALPPALPTGRVALLGSAIAAMVGVALGVQNTSGVIVSSMPHDPGSAIYHLGFMTMQMGPAAAISTLLLLIVIPLGVLSTRALLATRLRLRIEARHVAPAAGTTGQPVGPGGYTGAEVTGSGAGAIIAGVVVLGIALMAGAPWMLAALTAPGDPGVLVGGSSPQVPEMWPALLRTWLGGGAQVLVAAAVAVVAGIGIGYHRPLGERSMPVLLTVLSPVLLIGLLPLVVAHFLDRQAIGLLGTTPGGMYPQIVAVPLLFVCAYVADAVRAGDRSPAARGLMGPAVATIGLAVTTLLILRTANPTWSLTMVGPGTQDATSLAFRAWQQWMIPEAIALLRPVPVLLVLAVVVVVCAAGMRRVRLHTLEHPAYPSPAPGYSISPASEETLPPAGGGSHVPGRAWPQAHQ